MYVRTHVITLLIIHTLYRVEKLTKENSDLISRYVKCLYICTMAQIIIMRICNSFNIENIQFVCTKLLSPLFSESNVWYSSSAMLQFMSM